VTMPRRTLTDYYAPSERHHSWSRDWQDLSHSGRIALGAWALVVCPSVCVAVGYWVAVASSDGVINALGLAIAFLGPVALVTGTTMAARLRDYAVIALAVGALAVSGALYLGFLAWLGAQGAFS
jgi:hypothetical protein